MYYLLASKENDTHIVCGQRRKSEAGDTMAWPRHLDSPKEQLLIEPRLTSTAPSVTVRNVLDTRGERFELSHDIKLAPDQLEIIERHGHLFVPNEEMTMRLLVEKIKEDSSSPAVHALADRLPKYPPNSPLANYAINGINGAGSAPSNMSELHVPLYHSDDISAMEERGVMDNYQAIPMDHFLAHHHDNIAHSYFGISAAPQTLPPEVMMEVFNLQNSEDLSPEQKAMEIANTVAKETALPLTSAELSELMDKGVVNFRRHTSPLASLARFNDVCRHLPLPNTADMISRMLRHNNTHAAYASAAMVVMDKVNHHPDPGAAMLTVTGYLRHYLGDDSAPGSRVRYYEQLEEISHNLHHAGDVPEMRIDTLDRDVSAALQQAGFGGYQGAMAIYQGDLAQSTDVISALTGMPKDGYARLEAWAVGQNRLQALQDAASAVIHAEDVFPRQRAATESMVGALNAFCEKENVATGLSMAFKTLGDLPDTPHAAWLAHRAEHTPRPAPTQQNSTPKVAHR